MRILSQFDLWERSSNRLWIAGIFASLSFFLPASLFAQSPFPDLPASRVAVSGTPDDYDSVRQTIKQVAADSDQSYYAVVVLSTGSGPDATRNYTDRLYGHWRNSLKQHPVNLDRLVLIVVGLENRSISVRTGEELQTEFGLYGSTVDRELVQKTFIPQARQGDYAKGLSNLILEIEAWVDRKAQLEAGREAARLARQRRLKQTAGSTMLAVTALFRETDQLLKQHADSGLNLQPLEAKLQKNMEMLGDARLTIEKSPQTALDDLLSVQKQLRDLQSELTSLTQAQQAAETQAESLLDSLAGLEMRLEYGSAAGLTTVWLTDRVANIREEVSTLRSSLTSEPRDVLRKLKPLQARADELSDLLQDLPNLARQVHDSEEKTAALLEETRQQLRKADRSGVDVADARKTIQQLAKQTEAAETTAQHNYLQALQEHTSIRESLSEQKTTLEKATTRRRFWNRVVPLGMLVILIGIAVWLVGGRWFKRRSSHRKAKQRLDQLKTRAVEINESLDAFQRRHQQLPLIDQDFQNPMTGRTLEQYEDLQLQLTAARSDWLDIMNAWDQVQTLMETESVLGQQKLQQAHEAMDRIDPDQLAAQIEQNLFVGLEQLEQAHETAEVKLKTVDDRIDILQELLTTVETRSLSTVVYDPDFEAIREDRKEAGAQLPSDPITSQLLLDDCLDQLSDLGEWVQHVLELAEWHEELTSETATVRQDAAARRAEGFLFAEQGSDPDPLLEEAELHLQSGQHALELGDVESITLHLEETDTLLDRTADLIALQVEIRSTAAKQTQEVRQENRRLKELLATTEQARRRLLTEFAEESWKQVEHNLTSAKELLARIDQLLEEVLVAAGHETQHYLKALDLLEQIHLTQEEVESRANAVTRKLDWLTLQKTEFHSDYQKVHVEATSVHSMLAGHDEDRVPANQQYQRANRQLQEIHSLSQSSHPDWPRLREQLQDAQSDFVSARELAHQDFQLAAQAKTAIAQADRTIRQTKSFYRNGISAEISEATRLLNKARAVLDLQSYEQAIELSATAQDASRSALEEARQRARKREAELEQERLQRVTEQLGEIKIRDIALTAAAMAARALANKSDSQNRHARASRRRPKKKRSSIFSSGTFSGSSSGSGRTTSRGSASRRKRSSGSSTRSTSSSRWSSGTSQSSW